MGSTASKAATTTARKYPIRPSLSPSPALSSTPLPSRQKNIEGDGVDPGLQQRLQQLGPVKPQSKTMTQVSMTHLKSANIPSYTAPVTPLALSPNPLPNASNDLSLSGVTFIPSASTPNQSIRPTVTGQKSNAAVSLLTARYRLAEAAEAEFSRLGKSADEGRRFLDVTTIRQVLAMRHAERKIEDSKIERTLGLGKGVVKVLGRRGVVRVVE